jgi:hypothetical protein
MKRRPKVDPVAVISRNDRVTIHTDAGRVTGTAFLFNAQARTWTLNLGSKVVCASEANILRVKKPGAVSPAYEVA